MRGATAVDDDGFADFASAAPKVPPPLSPGSAARDRPLPEHDFAEPAPAAEHGATDKSAAAGSMAGDAFAVVSAAAEAQPGGPSEAGAIDLSSIAQRHVSVHPRAVAVTETVVLSTSSAAETDAFAAFSSTREGKGEAGAAAWAAEEGFGDFAVATKEDDVAAKLAAAGVAVSPKFVARDWCGHARTLLGKALSSLLPWRQLSFELMARVLYFVAPNVAVLELMLNSG